MKSLSLPSAPLRVLIVEDSEDDALLLVRTLRRGGYDLTFERVETAAAMKAALDQQTWDVVISDYSMPHFSGLAALTLLKESKLGLPFIILSGAIGEETAVGAMKAGAHDYIMKGNLARLIPAIERELQDAEVRRERKALEEMWRKYTFIANTSREFMTLIDANYTYEAVNESYCRAHNKAREEIVGRTVAGVWGEETFNTIIKGHLDKCFAGNEVHYQAWFEFATLGLRYIDVTYYPYYNEGTVTHAVVVSRDITERKRAEEELQDSLEKLRKALGGTIQAIALTVEMRDPYTAGHQRRVANLARALAAEMGLPKEQIDGIRMAGVIHDLGKISVPSEILSKPTRLRDTEFSLIKDHPQVGYDILKTIEFPWPVAQIVLRHHERLDGSGYPQGLSGEGILLEARILAVADVVEAMSSHRPYRPALGIDKALEEISQNRGVLYDSEVVGTCLKLITEKGFTLE